MTLKTEASSEGGRAERIAPPGRRMDVAHHASPGSLISRLVLQEVKNKPLSCLSLSCLSFPFHAAANLILIDTSVKKLI